VRPGRGRDRRPSGARPRGLVTRLLLAAVAVVGSAVNGIAAAAPDTCGEQPAAHALDFWLGDWEVRDADGNLAGTNRIEAALDGCAILEHWSGAGGSAGLSLFYFHSWLGQWRQVWITAEPLRPGAVKEKRQDLNYRGPGIRFQGEVMVSPEHDVQDRTTLVPLADGRVRQRIETSNDDGRSWQLVFEGWYRRRP
jgi:hypothetical protein